MTKDRAAPTEHDDEGVTDTTLELTEEERADALFRRLPNDPSARDELVKIFYPLAEYLGKRFRGRREPVEDLIQVASVGLIKAMDRFDPDRGVKFTTYATATIVGEIKRHFRDKGWALRVPRRIQEMGLEVSRVVSDLFQELGRSPTVREIATQTGFSQEEVLEAMDAVHAYTTTSLDAPSEEGSAEISRLGAPDEAIELLEGWESVAPALQKLPERERRILYLRFFRGLTQTQIADELDMSQMHVSRLLARTLRQLRETMSDSG